MSKYEITHSDIDSALHAARMAWADAAKKHSLGIYVSKHEAFGSLYEEFQELGDELRSEDIMKFRAELLDVIVVALHALASLDSRQWRQFSGDRDGGGR